MKQDRFWNASVDELKRGYAPEPGHEALACLICGERFLEGVVYPVDGLLLTAERAARSHVESAHAGMLAYLLGMGKTYTGLTDHQRALVELFHQGLSDKQIVQRTGATSTSTIRNQRFTIKEKYKQAKITVALFELLEQGKRGDKESESLVDIHRTATMIDERYAITQAERDEVLGRYFDQENRLVIKTFPAREKKKIIILQHLCRQFEPGRRYSEAEVNGIIQPFYDDIATIRRYLIEYGFLDRVKDGSAYWLKL